MPGVKAVIDALNVVYEEREKRGFIGLNLLSLAFTIGGIVALLLMVSAVVAFPLALDHLGLPPDSQFIVSLARWPLLFAVPAGGARHPLPVRTEPARARAGNGSASARWPPPCSGSPAPPLLSWYLSNFGNYSATYGSLGAAIGLMMWMWMSAIIVLFGAELNSEIEHQTGGRHHRRPAQSRSARRGATMADTRGARGSGRAKRTLAQQINIDAKVTALGGAQTRPCLKISVFSRVGQFGPEGVARDMIRISTIFIAICMVLVAASLGLVLHSVAGISGSESAIVALTALTFLILYNAVSMRLRDRSDVGSQIADLSRGTADLARQVAEFGRRLAAVEGRVVSANSAGERPHPGRGRRDQRTRRAGQAARSPPSPAMTICWPRARRRRRRQPAIADTPEFEPEIEPPSSAEPERAVAARPAPVATAAPARAAAPIAEAAPSRSAAATARRGEKRRRGKPARYLSAADGDAAAAQGALLRGGDAAARRQGPDSRRRRFHRHRRSRRADRAHRPHGDVALCAGAAPPDGAQQGCRRVLQRRPRRRSATPPISRNASTSSRPTARWRRPSCSNSSRRRSAIWARPRPSISRRCRSAATVSRSTMSATSGSSRANSPTAASASSRCRRRCCSIRGRASTSDIHPSDLSDLLGRFGIDLIAERIEGERAVVDLLDFDVRFGQGFLFAPPRPLRPEGASATGGATSTKESNGSNGSNAPSHPAPVASPAVEPSPRATGNAALARRAAGPG